MSSITAERSQSRSGAARARRITGAEIAKKAGLYVLLVVAAGILAFPLFFALSLALQGPTLAPNILPDLGNLDWSVFGQTFAQESNPGRWVLNSFVVSLAVILGQIITSALAAYALAFFKFPGKSFFFVFSWQLCSYHGKRSSCPTICSWCSSTGTIAAWDWSHPSWLAASVSSCCANISSPYRASYTRLR